MIRILKLLLILVLSLAPGPLRAQNAQPITGRANTWSGTQTHTGALVCRGSTTLPGTCLANLEIYIDTDATPAGQQLYLCNATGSGWNLIGDGGAGGSAHAILSATHTDSTAAAVVRGDLIAGIGLTPTWQRLAVGTATSVLHGGTEPSYSAVSLTAVFGVIIVEMDTTAPPAASTRPRPANFGIIY